MTDPKLYRACDPDTPGAVVAAGDQYSTVFHTPSDTVRK